MTIQDAAREFLAKKRVAVTGVSRKPQTHAANVIRRGYRRRRRIEAQELTKRFTQEEFLRITRCANLAGAFAFWRQLERVAEPGDRTRRHAVGILRAMAESQFRDCRGVAFSPQDAEIFRRFGFEPVRTMAPGEAATE